MRTKNNTKQLIPSEKVNSDKPTKLIKDAKTNLSQTQVKSTKARFMPSQTHRSAKFFQTKLKTKEKSLPKN